MKLKKVGLVLASTAAAAMFVLGGASLASADSGTPSPTGSAAPGKRAPGTPVTGDEATKVTAAVTAKFPGVTVGGVHKGTDGSYHVFGTKDGNRVKYDVSADLGTVTEGKGRPGGGRGGARPEASPSASTK
ncbi:hypothetical protein Val02_48370 [Virgisporangium aliadipatigenens]|uniref:PepSY domain-containing protein n=1 Tax=Virgisporangium aliadipatigenens TaxID=741659 RepID=A0A8J4DSA0_9ACTN|nr:hypothetical protein [Virgisporangium aliadipatigenens]GIJ47951.1 hypothetical protein Val02_48370 [Virgisporangium aliadipatigenens]